MPQHHVLERGQPFDADGPTRMEFVSADADFGTQPVLKSVGKTCAGIDHHTAAVDLPQKTLGMKMIGGDDGVGMVRGLAVDVRNGFIKPADHLDTDDRR